MGRTKPRVLVIDDDPRVGADLKAILDDYEVLVVSGVAQALVKGAKQAGKEFCPHIAIIDIRLVDDYRSIDRTGILLINDLRSAKCIVYSGYIGAEEARLAAESGAYGWIGKQEPIEELIQKIDCAAKEAFASDDQIKISMPENGHSDMITRALFSPGANIPENIVQDVIRQLFPGSKKVDLLTLDGAAISPISVSCSRSVVLKAVHDARREPVVVKFAPAKNIECEHKNYLEYIDENLAGNFYASVVGEPVLFWDLGAMKYRLVSEPGQLSVVSFASYYARQHNADAILKPLEHFFKVTWGGFYRDTEPSQVSLFHAFDRILKLESKLKNFPNRGKYWQHPVIATQLLNPITWVEQHKNDSADIKPTRQAITHGDMHGDNLLTSENYAWAIDFERSGPGPILRDFVELEVDIVTRLVPEDKISMEQYGEFILKLISPSKPNEKITISKTIHSNEEFLKAARVLNGLREVAVSLTKFSDMREYYWGLLLDAVFVTSLLGEQDSRGKRAMLLGSLLCHRLDSWGKAWPPRELTSTIRV